jgi:hypothetical protein
MMRRLILLAAGLSVVGALTGGLSAQASPGGNGAEVIREGGDCLASDNSGSSWLFSCDFQIVFGPSGSITEYITGSVIPEESSPLPSRAITDVTGGPCLVLGGEVLTTVVAGVVTPSGHVQLICKN